MWRCDGLEAKLRGNKMPRNDASLPGAHSAALDMRTSFANTTTDDMVRDCHEAI